MMPEVVVFKLSAAHYMVDGSVGVSGIKKKEVSFVIYMA